MDHVDNIIITAVVSIVGVFLIIINSWIAFGVRNQRESDRKKFDLIFQKLDGKVDEKHYLLQRQELREEISEGFKEVKKIINEKEIKISLECPGFINNKPKHHE